MSKYHSKKIYIYEDGLTAAASGLRGHGRVKMIFDSSREYDRFCSLYLEEKAGLISDLRRQVRYELIPTQYVGGKLTERSCSYIADFVYEQNGKTIVEDSKGFKTPEYIIKRKLMLYVHGIQIKEV